MAQTPTGDGPSAPTAAPPGPGASAYAAVAADLRAAVEGAVRFDEYARVLYASDGSIYQAQPAGVVEPKHVDDVRSAVAVASEHGIPIIARGAGSSLAGQAVGPGCVVVDLSTHMDGILEVRPDEKRAVVQPGVVQDHLDDRLAADGLKFAPDPASSNRATIGGGIGNNSTGAHSVRYGITDAYTERLRVVLADGSLIETRDVVLDSPEWDRLVGEDTREAELYRTVRGLVETHEAEIERRYPDLKRNVSGYNLDRVIYENDDGDRVINLTKLFVGAESTLGIVVEAELSLVSRPPETALALYCFDDLIEALEAVPAALEFDVSAVELMDDEVFRLARESDQYARYEAPIPNDAAAALMIEFDSELVDDFEAAIAETTDRFVDNGTAFEVIEAYTESEQSDLWKLRKAAIPLLMSLDGDPKPYPFIEDATVPPSELAEYTQKFMDVLEDHGTSAAYFAHAGSGTLHIRPILSLKDGEEIELMRSIADDVTDIVAEHHGSFSGEHGDGLARTEFNPKMYGEELWGAFRELKTAFDPEWLLNPGKVVYRDDDDPTDMRENLRYGADYASVEPQTKLDFSAEGGFSQLVELCNGCGTCRQEDDDVMCPTYRATDDEMATTRGRANMLRAAISGDLPEGEMLTAEFQEEVLDLCVGCKGCKSDCPTGVDMAKLKSEVKHQYHEAEGSSLRTKLFGNIDTASAWGSKLAPVSNWMTAIPGSRTVLETVFGIAPERSVPPFASESLVEWAERREPRVSESAAERKVLLFPDTYTNYSYPEPGKAAVRVLEAAGIHVRVPTEVGPSGRAAYSVGLLDKAADRARRNVDVFSDYLDDGWEVVAVEPSDAVAFQDEYLDLLDDPDTERVAANAYGVCEYLDVHRLVAELPIDEGSVTESLAYHGHCHQHAAGTDHHAVGVLRRAGYDVDPLDSGCCGMAGSFGYEAEHYDVSTAIAELLFEKIRGSGADRVVAPGGSCRSQIGDGDVADDVPPHPVELLAQAVDGHARG
jgi:FAD/FMN-containing dehydrogenase/Fe-S oxidoreductase